MCHKQTSQSVPDSEESLRVQPLVACATDRSFFSRESILATDVLGSLSCYRKTNMARACPEYTRRQENRPLQKINARSHRLRASCDCRQVNRSPSLAKPLSRRPCLGRPPWFPLHVLAQSSFSSPYYSSDSTCPRRRSHAFCNWDNS